MNHRHLIGATSGVFVLGAVAFAPSLQLRPALATLAGCAGVFAIVWTSRGDDAFLAETIDARFWAGCLLASLAILIVGGEGHFLHATNDWLIRDAILADMARQAGDFDREACQGNHLAPYFHGTESLNGGSRRMQSIYDTVMLH